MLDIIPAVNKNAAGKPIENLRRICYNWIKSMIEGQRMSKKEKQEKRSKNSQLLPLFLSFLKIGAFTFGGGAAMIPLIQKEAAERHKWVTDENIIEIVAIAESTPGPIAVNAATFTGYHAAGVPGAALATVGVVLPAFLVIAAVSSALTLFGGNQWVRWAFGGIRAGVLALIVKSLAGMYRQCPKNALSYVVTAGVFIAAGFLNVSVLLLIVLCALLGLFFTLRKRGGEQ